jgi:hypothetical protein
VIQARFDDFRDNNTEKFFQEFYSMVNPLGITEPRTVSPKVWYRILEGASLENDDFLRKRYAAMLANAMDPDFKVSIQPMFVETLKLLSVLEVQFLDELYANTVSFPGAGIGGRTLHEVAEHCTVPPDDLQTLLESLQRHGLLRLTAAMTHHEMNRIADYSGLAQITRLGCEFYSACKPPSAR